MIPIMTDTYEDIFGDQRFTCAEMTKTEQYGNHYGEEYTGYNARCDVFSVTYEALRYDVNRELTHPLDYIMRVNDLGGVGHLFTWDQFLLCRTEGDIEHPDKKKDIAQVKMCQRIPAYLLDLYDRCEKIGLSDSPYSNIKSGRLDMGLWDI